MSFAYTSKLGFYTGALGDGRYETYHNQAAQNLEDRLATQYSGNPNGNVAGYWKGQPCWDIANDLQYICTTTGDAASAVWTLQPSLGANTLVGAQSITGDLTIISTDAGAAIGPVINLDRKSASAADADEGGAIRIRFNNDAGTPELVIGLEFAGKLLDATDGSEDVGFTLRQAIAGALTDILTLDENGAFTFAGAVDVGSLSVGGEALTGLSFAKYEDQATSGSDGGSPTADAWTKWPVDTEVADADAIGSIASNVMTLIAGTYIAFFAGTIFGNVDNFRLRLRDTTNNATLAQSVSVGQTSIDVAGGVASGWATPFTVATTMNIELQYFLNTTGGTGALGKAVTTGENEVYAQVLFIKIA